MMYMRTVAVCKGLCYNKKSLGTLARSAGGGLIVWTALSLYSIP